MLIELLSISTSYLIGRYSMRELCAHATVEADKLMWNETNVEFFEIDSKRKLVAYEFELDGEIYSGVALSNLTSKYRNKRLIKNLNKQIQKPHKINKLSKKTININDIKTIRYNKDNPCENCLISLTPDVYNRYFMFTISALVLGSAQFINLLV